ncbi:amidohydrolase [Microbacterium sp. ASV49]|uniref:Amidohydrolase family protein n=1 Tax=Microbacterium candidum TaxID=3041922 RepID=A0ABT7N0Q4_9MICO|nr:amidohydrolase family protein [Microbacterium sp. ASV49]MDL9980278.1 amidohydrolase family protein [Microbacterium sp. ASV49]
MTDLYAESIVLAARIHTMTGEDADALAVSDGRVLAVGGREEVARLAGPETRILEFPGATVIPGLVDAHTHPILSLDMVRGTSFTGITTPAELRAALERGRDEQADSEWFLGWGLDPNAFEGEPIGNGFLHEVLGVDRPAYVKMFDAHSAVASAAALARAGIDAPLVNDDGSSVVDDGTGRPSGHVLEFTVMDLVEAVLPSRTFADRVEQLRDLLGRMAARGITATHVMDLQADDALELLEAIEADGELPVRLRLSPWCEPTSDDADVERILTLQERSGRRWSVEGVKLFIDGTVEGGTAWLDAPDALGKSTTSFWSDHDAYAGRVALFHERGIPTATHAIGEHGIRFVAQTLAALPQPGPQHRIEHIESVDGEVIELLGAGGVAASMQPTHCTHYVRADGSDDWSRRLGAQRAGRAWRTADVRAAGATLALGSDWPVVGFDPWEIMADAQLRRPADRPDVAPVAAGQALTALQALEGYTTHAHRSVGAEAGVLAPGAAADLVVIDRDPLTVSPEELAQAEPLLTMLNGAVTHRA